MKYEDLPAYVGPKSACDNCEREFKLGETISANSEKNLIFCYSDANGGCVIAYVFSSGKMLVCKPMRFKDAELPEEEQTPNYPNTPVRSFKPVWLKNLLDSLFKRSP